MADLKQIQALALNGISMVQAEALLGRSLTPEEVSSFRKAVSVRKLQIAQRKKRPRLNDAETRRMYRAHDADIASLPPVKNPERRKAAEADAVEFARSYCSSLFAHEIPAKLAEYAHAIQRAIEARTGLVHTRLSRGVGKSTLFKSTALWALCTGRLKYLVVIAATQSMANSILADLWKLLEGSEALAEDFPEICVPIAALGGKAQRAPIITYKGKPTRIRRSGDEIQLPTMEGYPCSGAVVVARGAGGSCRGLVRGSLRPQMVLLDDLCKRADAISPARVRKLEAWIQGDVLGLGGSDGIAAVMTSTPIAPNDLSELYASAEHPEWSVVEYPLVLHAPANEELWKEYDEIFVHDMAEGDSTGRSATLFYERHREAMDEGVEMVDALAFGQNERSAYQRARNLLLRMGRTAFEAEFQLKIPRISTTVGLTPQMVENTTTGFPRFVLPPGCIRLVAFVDVGTSSRLHYAVLAVGKENLMSIVDYGALPERGRMIPPKSTEDQVNAILAKSLVSLGERLYGQDYRDADGKRVPLFALTIDEGWRTSVVRRVCTLFQVRGFRNTLPCKGFDATRYVTGGKTAVFKAKDVSLRRMDDGTLSLAQNSDAWKEYAQRAFLGTPLQSGSLSLFGDDPAPHHDFALQITAEKLTDKAVSQRGLPMYKWSLTPGGQNHFLDAVAGALATLSYYHFLVDPSIPDTPPKSTTGTAPQPTARGIPKSARKRHRIKLRSP